MRVLIDTNVFVSAMISAGPPRQLVNAGRAGVFNIYTSETLLAEMLDVLSRDKFAARLRISGLTAAGIVEDIRRVSTVVSPLAVPRVVAGDPDDDHVLAAALAGGVDLVATGDKRDLSPLGSYQGIEIVTPRVALESIGKDGATRAG